MAYATGSAANANELLSAIRDFAALQGWTIDKTATNLLFLSKGICKVTLEAITYNISDYTTGSLVTRPDTYLASSLCTTIDVSRSVYWGHPGSLVTTSTDADRVATNMLQGPFTEYHLFSGGAGDPDYVICAVKTSADAWRTFGFGMVDKGALTHSGAAWLAGGRCGYFYRHTSSTITNWRHNDVDQHPYPFCVETSSVENISNAARQLYCPDALPNTADWPVMRADTMMSGLTTSYNPNEAWPGGSSPRLLSPINGAKVSDWGGNMMLMPIPLMPTAAAITRSCYIGDIPGIRGANIEGFTSGQEIALGADTWKLFSIGRQGGWGTQTQIGDNYSTGHFGLAIKKNV